MFIKARGPKKYDLFNCKGGITHFTKQLASYYGKDQIRVNNICPGGIEGKFKGTNKSFDIKFSKKYIDQTLLKDFVFQKMLPPHTFFGFRCLFLYYRNKFSCRWWLDRNLIFV